MGLPAKSSSISSTHFAGQTSTMDTIDRPDSNVPARIPANSFRPPASVPVFSRDLATAPSPQINPQLIARGLARPWGRILLLWLVVSIPVAGVIWYFVPPGYEAQSLLRIEPTQIEVFSDSLQGGASDRRSIQDYIGTQIQLMKSNSVLDGAVANREVVNFPMIKGSDDPKADLRENLVVEPVAKGSYLIRVALE